MTVVFITELTLPEKGQIKLKVSNSWEQCQIDHHRIC